MGSYKFSDGEKELYDGIYTYGPLLVRDSARLASCLASFFQANIGGAGISIIINEVAPTLQGSVVQPYEGRTRSFEDVQDLQFILDEYAQETEVEYDKKG